MTESKSETDKVQTEPGIYSWVRKKKNIQRLMGRCQKVTEASLHGAPSDKYGPIFLI